MCKILISTKRLVLLSFLFFTLNYVYSQKIEFKVQYSENYAAFEFLKHLSENYPQNAFRKVFENSKYNTVDYRNFIKEFNSLNYFYWYEYKQYPYGNKIGGSTYFILSRNLIESKTLEEFKLKSYGIIPNSDLNKFYAILSKFLPIYKEIVFKPSKKKFNNQLKQVRELIAKTDINSPFLDVLNFHKSTWDFTIPFHVSLYPIPDSRTKGFTATAFYNQAIGGIPQGLNDFELLLSVMFHEAFHILYDEQPLGVKKDIDLWFRKHKSNSSRYAQLLFNEAITTSLANGYLYRNIKGELLKKSWYNNKYISEMAKAIFSTIEKYLNKKKTIDEDFIKIYIDLFDKRFSSWLKEIDHLMMQRFVISENKVSHGIIYKNYQYANIIEQRDKLNALSIEDMKTHPITKVIIVTNDNESKLRLVKNSFDELKNWKPEYNKDFSYSKFLNDKTYLIILNSKNGNINNLLKNMKIK